MLDVIKLEGNELAIAAALPSARTRNPIRVGSVRITRHIPFVRRVNRDAQHLNVEPVADIPKEPGDAPFVRTPPISARPTLPVARVAV